MAQSWRITGYNGDSEFFTTTVAGNMANEAVIGRMLQALAARHLTDSEIVNSLNPDLMTDLLAVMRDMGSDRLAYRCGDTPYYVAVLEQSD